MKCRFLVFTMLVAVYPAIATADLWSDLKKIAKDTAAETIKPKPEPAPPPKPKPVVKTTVAKPTAKKSKPSEPLTRAEIVKFQECLNMRGFNAGTPDGLIGRKTIDATIAFKQMAKDKRGAESTIIVNGDIDKAVATGCTMFGFGSSMNEKPKVLTGKLMVTASNGGQEYPMTWEATTTSVGLGATVIYYFGSDAKGVGRFRWKASNIRYHCEKGTQDKFKPKGAFRKKNNSAFHMSICAGKGKLLKVTYAQ